MNFPTGIFNFKLEAKKYETLHIDSNLFHIQVSDMYKEPSLGTVINIVVTKILVLDTDEVRLFNVHKYTKKVR